MLGAKRVHVNVCTPYREQLIGISVLLCESSVQVIVFDIVEENK